MSNIETIFAPHSLARRPSQRAMLRIGVTLRGIGPDGKDFTLPAHTVQVMPRGACLRVAAQLPAEARIVVEHNTTHERQPCRVTRPPLDVDGAYELPIEFEGDAPRFWQVKFPPVE
jgi:hypothetical protein